MKHNFSFIYKVFLVVGDAFALTLAFSVAYVLRVTLDPRPIAVPVPALTYIMPMILLLPIWLAMFGILGLYTKRIYERRPKEATRLFIGSIFGVLLLVTFDFFSNEVIFPAKLIPIYAVFTSFVVLWVMRTILRGIRLSLYQHGYGVTRILLIGSSETTYYLSKYLYENVRSGLELVSIVASKSSIYEKKLNLQFKSAAVAIKETKPHAIIQTDSDNVAKIYNLAIDNHLDYQFIPNHSALFTSKHSIELLGAFPIINVHTTPLIGYGRAVKRVIDIIVSLLGLIISLPITLVVALLMKVTDFKNPVLFKQKRLSRFNQPIYIYKFRTHKSAYNGLSPEEAFTKMGRPELIAEYRANADSLVDDPRVTKLGKVLRRTKFDELPQFINILKGDISLVGPRALMPYELENYEFKSLILSVKSGLTGLAQISGREDISFEERRKLDMYYVQNWSIWMDFQIMIRTIFTVIRGKGTR